MSSSGEESVRCLHLFATILLALYSLTVKGLLFGIFEINASGISFVRDLLRSDALRICFITVL